MPPEAERERENERNDTIKCQSRNEIVFKSSEVRVWLVAQFNNYNAGHCIKHKQSIELVRTGRAESQHHPQLTGVD